MRQDACVLNLGAAMQGPKWVDVSKQGNNGIATGARFKESSWYFDGIDDFVDVGNHTSLDITEAITIEILAKVGAFTASDKMLVGNSPGSSQYNYVLRIYDNYVYCGFFTAVWSTGIAAGLIADTNKWYHITATAIEGSDVYLYVDGLERAAGTAGSSHWTTTEVKVGAMRPTSVLFFEGSISLVRIYNIAFTAQQVKEAYEQSYRLI